MKLTDKQSLFVSEYLIDFNATQAAIRSGYSRKTAYIIGHENLRKPKIQKALQIQIEARMERLQMSQDEVLLELRLLGMSSIEHYQVDENGELVLAPGAPEGAMRAVSGFKKRSVYDEDGGVTHHVEFRLWNKPQSLTLVGRHLGMWVDKVEHKVEGSLNDKSDEELRRMVDELREQSSES